MDKCTRCDGMIDNGQMYPTCISCGYENYEAYNPNQSIRRSSALRADMQIVEYLGKNDAFTGKKINVWIRKSLMPECYCGIFSTLMKHSRRKSKDGTEIIRPYQCHKGHRVDLIETKQQGLTGWRTSTSKERAR
jgi:hypothetical protein